MEDLLFLVGLMAIIMIASFVLLYLQNDPNNPAQTNLRNNSNQQDVAGIRSTPTVSTKSLTDSQNKWHSKLPSKFGRRIITCEANNIIYNSSTIESHNTIKEDVISIIKDISCISDFYLICLIHEDQKESQIIKQLEDAGLLWSESNPKGIRKHKVLFCESNIGRIAMIRQLEPNVHLESNDEVIKAVQKYIPMILRISSSPIEIPLENSVTPTSSLSTFFQTNIA